MDKKELAELDEQLRQERILANLPDEEFWLFANEDLINDSKEDEVEEEHEKSNFLSLFRNDDTFAELVLKNQGQEGELPEEIKKLIELGELEKKVDERFLLFKLPYLEAEDLYMARVLMSWDLLEIQIQRCKRILDMTAGEFEFWVMHLVKNNKYKDDWKDDDYIPMGLIPIPEDLKRLREKDESKPGEEISVGEKAMESIQLKKAVNERIEKMMKTLTTALQN